MRESSRAIASLIACLALWTSCGPRMATEPGEVDLVILHVNDTHGELNPFETEDGRNAGGFARLATMVRETRQEVGEGVLLMHAGDILRSSNPLTLYWAGEVNVRAMNRLGFDAFTPGNGEFYIGLQNLERQTALADFPVFLANLVSRDTGERLFPPYAIEEVGGVRVAILGLGFIRQGDHLVRDLVLQNPMEVAGELVPILRNQADLVVALTHIGAMPDSVLAARVPGIDIIVGGHSHTQLHEPLRVPRSDGNGEVVITQAGGRGEFLGRIDVRMRSTEAGFRVSRVRARLLPVHDGIREDSALAGFLGEYSDSLEQVVFVSEEDLDSPTVGESSLGNLVTEGLRAETEAEVVLLDRDAVAEELGAGEVTRFDLLRAHRWRNGVLELELTGAQIQRALTEADLLAAGCTFRRTGEGIADLEIGGLPVDPERSYRVVMGEFVLYEVPFLRELPFTETGLRVYLVVEEYLRK